MMRVVCAGVVVLVLAIAAAAAQVRLAPPPVEYREFTSKINERDYATWVLLPDSYTKDASRRYPVMYVTDGQLIFPLMSSIYRGMYLGKDDNLPELIIVGVDSKPGDTWAALRFVNLTPTRSLKREAEMGFMNGLHSGEGPTFLRVLTEEVLPDIDRRYRTSDDRTLTGFSLGGLFGAYTLFQAPNTFRRMILGSPAFYWDDTVIFKIEEQFAGARKPLRTRVFIAAGGAEESAMIEPFQRFVSVVNNRHYEGLSLESHIFEDETHMSSEAPIAARGLRVVFRESPSK
jgi:predicted alpha/beta superfamily hydrolase